MKTSIFSAILFLGFAAACGGGADSADGGWDTLTSRLHMAAVDARLQAWGGRDPRLGRVDDLPPLPEDRNLDYTFPDTLCGHLVGRLLQCEIERIQKQPRMSESEKQSVISYKRRTFARKRAQYLAHCEKTAAKLQESDIRECMRLPCVEMDRCLQKISGQTGAK